MKQRLAAGEKVIYFANRVSTVLNLYRNALQEYRNEAAVSFSSDDELDKQEKETREILENATKFRHTLPRIKSCRMISGFFSRRAKTKRAST